MFTTLYVSDSIGIALMVVLLITNREHFTNEKKARYLLRMIIITIITCAMEILASVFDGKSGAFATIAIYAGNSWLYIANLFVAFCWTRLVYDCLSVPMSKPIKLVTRILNALGMILIIVNVFVPLVFSVDNNVYSRQAFFWLYILFGFINIGLGIGVYY